MCLSIDISQSEEKEFNIGNSYQIGSEGFNFSIETFGRGIGTSIDKEIEHFIVMFINCSSYVLKDLNWLSATLLYHSANESLAAALILFLL